MPESGTVYIHVPQTATESGGEIQKLNTLVSETEAVVYQTHSAFPFQLFPDKLIIDKNKATIVRKHLFFKRIFPMLYEDIQTVRVNRGLIFASLEFEVRGFEQNPGPITHLWPENASRAERYVLGIIKAKREAVDLTKISTKKIKKGLRGIGKTEEEVEKLF